MVLKIENTFSREWFCIGKGYWEYWIHKLIFDRNGIFWYEGPFDFTLIYLIHNCTKCWKIWKKISSKSRPPPPPLTTSRNSKNYIFFKVKSPFLGNSLNKLAQTAEITDSLYGKQSHQYILPKSLWGFHCQTLYSRFQSSKTSVFKPTMLKK